MNIFVIEGNNVDGVVSFDQSPTIVIDAATLQDIGLIGTQSSPPCPDGGQQLVDNDDADSAHGESGPETDVSPNLARDTSMQHHCLLFPSTSDEHRLVCVRQRPDGTCARHMCDLFSERHHFKSVHSAFGTCVGVTLNGEVGRVDRSKISICRPTSGRCRQVMTHQRVGQCAG